MELSTVTRATQAHTHRINMWSDFSEASQHQRLKRLQTRLPQFIVSTLHVDVHKVHDKRNNGV